MGAVAGVAGLGIGLVLLVFRDLIRKLVLRSLPPDLAYRVVRLIIAAAWSIAVLGIATKFAPEGAFNAVLSGNNNHQTISK